MPSSSRSLASRSIVSFTGISSASATATIAVCFGLVMKRSIVLAWLWIGPTLATSA